MNELVLKNHNSWFTRVDSQWLSCHCNQNTNIENQSAGPIPLGFPWGPGQSTLHATHRWMLRGIWRCLLEPSFQKSEDVTGKKGNWPTKYEISWDIVETHERYRMIQYDFGFVYFCYTPNITQHCHFDKEWWLSNGCWRWGIIFSDRFICAMCRTWD